MIKGINVYYIYFMLSQVIWGVLPAFWILLRDLSPLYTLASRIVWSSVLCFILIMHKHLLSNLTGLCHQRKQWPYIAGACLLVTINWGAFIYAMTRGFILQASLAYFINPIVVIFFGGLIFHETISLMQKLSMFLAASGLVLAFCLYGQVPYLSFIICLSWASYSLLKKKIVLDSQVSVFIESFSMVPLSLLFICFSEMHGTGAIGTFHDLQWLLLPATGIVTAIPMMLFTAGVKGVPITVSGILMYCSPSITLVIGLLSGEVMTRPMLVAFIFAWIAVAIYITGIYRTMKQIHSREGVQAIRSHTQEIHK